MNVVYIGVGTLLLLWILGSLRRRRKNRNSVISVIESNCTGCGRCVKRCSRRVLERVRSET
ncbi:MAG: 4Fe-4S binding protein, partial [Prevotellaceae bacterium]|nr:4Fe-4S binding protein [Prevotellaceae bacterium]